MKPSIYNVLVDNNGEALIYNTLKRSFAALSPQALECYRTGTGEHLSALAAGGFLVDDPEWEKSIQERTFDADRTSTNWLSISIVPSMACNFACPYCMQRGAKDTRVISDEVIDATLDFFDEMYARNHFEEFNLGWYGGEATLYMDLIERTTDKFRQRCEERGVEFSVGVVSNCSIIDEELAKRLANLGVKYIMPTIDGMSKLHNCRRVSKNGTDSFEACMTSIGNCCDAGINVTVNMNADKVNMPEFQTMRDYLGEHFGIEAYPSLLKDYCEDYGDNVDGFDDSAYSLYTREEYAHAIHDLFKETPYTREVLEELLRPMRNFCTCEMDGTYAVDPEGDVYRCAGWLGNKGQVYFNMLDRPPIDQIPGTNYNPLRDPECCNCAYEPLCKGECRLDRATMKDGCHISRYVLGEYLKDYRAFFGEAIEPVTLFVEPMDVVEFFGKPYYRDAPDESIWAGAPTYEHDEEGRLMFTKGTFFLDTEKVREAGIREM